MNYEIVITNKVAEFMVKDYDVTMTAFCTTYHAYLQAGCIVFDEGKYYDLFMLKYGHLICD